MADCTKTVEFLREWDRMCDVRSCIDCPLIKASSTTLNCRGYLQRYPDDAIAIVQKWSDEHPVQTYLSKLKEAFPNCDHVAMVTEACPGWVFGRGPNRFHTPCDGREEHRCGDCWNGEYKEAEK